MKINGKQIQSTNIDDILHELEKLPPSFPELAEISKSKKIVLSKADLELFNQSDDIIDRFIYDDITTDVERVAELYKRIIINFTELVVPQSVYGEKDDLYSEVSKYNLIRALSSLQILIAKTYYQNKEYDKVKECYNNIIEICIGYPQRFLLQMEKDIEFAVSKLIDTHSAAGTIEEFCKQQMHRLQSCVLLQGEELKVRLILGEINSRKGNIELSAKHYSKAYVLQQSCVDYTAHRITQREFAISKCEKIGTYNIKQCIAVIINEPNSNATALVHFDKYTDPYELNKVLSQLSSISTAKIFDVYLSGGRDVESKDTSNNVKQIIQFFQKQTCYKVDFKSADIGEKFSPACIVFDPIVAKVEPSAPGKTDNTIFAREIMLGLQEKKNMGYLYANLI